MQKLREEIDIIMGSVRNAVTAHDAEFLTGRLPAKGRAPLSTAMSTIRSYGALINSAYDKLETLRLDDTMYPEGRKRMMRDVLADAEQKTEDKHRTADNNAIVARAVFIAGAFPTLARNREMIARQDARMILDAVEEPDVLIARLAKRQDDVGALVVTQWGADYLHSRGYDERDVQTIRDGIVGMALEGAAAHGDGERSAAARGAMAAQSAIGLNDAAAGAARELLSTMRDYYQVPREDHPTPRDPRRPAAPKVLGEDIQPPSF